MAAKKQTKPVKKRTSIPRNIKEAAKAEAGHRCALCRAPHLDIHHIDEDPSNNALTNLIALCPNCHQGRVHGRAGHRLDADALRRYKDLHSRFAATGAYELLLKRSSYITSGKYAAMTWDDLVDAFNDLVSFVCGLKHGAHLADRLRRFVAPPWQVPQVSVEIIGLDDDFAQRRAERDKLDAKHLQRLVGEYRDKLNAARGQVVDMLDEVLMAQDSG